jgi:hypothetical protein
LAVEAEEGVVRVRDFVRVSACEGEVECALLDVDEHGVRVECGSGEQSGRGHRTAGGGLLGRDRSARGEAELHECVRLLRSRLVEAAACSAVLERDFEAARDREREFDAHELAGHVELPELAPGGGCAGAEHELALGLDCA